jgi:hypothetical protein
VGKLVLWRRVFFEYFVFTLSVSFFHYAVLIISFITAIDSFVKNSITEVNAPPPPLKKGRGEQTKCVILTTYD